MIRLDGKVALVTGGTSGQGEATTRLLVASGAKVVFSGIENRAGQKMSEEFSGNAVYVQHDVRNSADWVKAVLAAETNFGRLTSLVNTAGISFGGALVDLEEVSINNITAINQIGPLLGMRYAVPAMLRAGGGAIVNVGSQAGVRGYPRLSAYSSTKAALGGMTRSAAAELAVSGIRVNLINPGPIDTPMFQKMVGENAAEVARNVPLGRIGQPVDVAYLIRFLLSDEASFITGAEIAVDGGVAL